jgi:hypothetical protein
MPYPVLSLELASRMGRNLNGYSQGRELPPKCVTSVQIDAIGDGTE